MGLLDFLKRKPKKTGTVYVPTQTGRVPVFMDFGDNIYASDIIVQAIRCKANEFKKLKPRHIRTTNGKQEVVTDSSIARCLRRPNEYMTQSDFFEKITILLELNKNAFIYPTYYVTNGGARYYTGLYPLKPIAVEYVQDNSARLYMRFTFGNGYIVTLPAEDVIHWRKDYGVDDYFGGNMLGGNDNSGLLKLLKEYDKITQSIAVGLGISTKINGIVKTNSYLADEKIEAQQKEFNERLLNNESGILFTDLKADYTNIPRDVKLVDKDTMDFFYQAILRNTSGSLAILNGDYTKAQKEAYYEHALEADIKSLGEAMSKVVFTEREEAYGNAIVLYPNSIVFMSMENKLTALQIGLPAGIFIKDEARELLGYPPLPNGQGEVIAQGYNALLDENNNNKLQGDGNASAPADDEAQQIIADAEDVVKKPLLVGQIQSMTQIILEYQQGNYTYNQALNMLMIGVGLTQEEAEKLLDKQDDKINEGGADNGTGSDEAEA